jgi:hypothetical protein
VGRRRLQFQNHTHQDRGFLHKQEDEKPHHDDHDHDGGDNNVIVIPLPHPPNAKDMYDWG